MVYRLQTEQELDAYPQDDWGYIQDIVSPPAPALAAALAPAPFNPVGFDWSQGIQNIGGTIYQPQYSGATGGIEEGTFVPGELQNVLRYKEGATGPGQSYEIIDPATGQVTGTGKFQEQSHGFFGDLWDMVSQAASDLAPVLQYTPVGPAVAAINAVNAARSGDFLPAIASVAGYGGYTDLANTAKAVSAIKNEDYLGAIVPALTAAGVADVAGFKTKDIGNVINVARAIESENPLALFSAAAKFAPAVSDQASTPVGTTINPDTNTPMIVYDDGSSIEYIPGKAGTAGTTIVTDTEGSIYRPGSNPLLPSNIEEALFAVQPEYGTQEAIDVRTQELINEILGIPSATTEAPVQPIETTQSAPAEVQTYPVTAEQNIAYTPEETQSYIESLIRGEAALPTETPAQQVEVTAPKQVEAPVDAADYLESIQPQPTPATPIEEFKFQEANVMPEGPQQVVTTAEKETALPEVLTQPTPQDVQDYIQSVINAEAALPKDETQRVEVSAPAPQYTPEALDFIQNIVQQEAALPKDETQQYTATGQLPDQTFYELPEAPVVQDLYQPAGVVEGPSKIDVTGSLYKPDAAVIEDIENLLTRYEDQGFKDVTEAPTDQTVQVTGAKETPEPIYEQPPTPEPEPIYEQPPTPAPTPSPAPAPAPTPAPSPAPTPSPAPAPAPTPAPSPAPTPSPAPAPKAQSGLDLSALFALLAMSQQQRPAADPYQVAQIRAQSPFGSILDEEQPSMEDLLQLIGRG